MLDPLDDPAFLLSVVEVVTDSLTAHSSVSVHDLLDAYATFANRVRSHSARLEPRDAVPSALAPLKIHKDDFVHALRRDVRLAHIDPLSSVSRSRPFAGKASCGNSVQADTKQYARDSSSLCHHALCALVTIFRFPAFHSVFHERDLSLLFGDVLDIALADQLPVLNKAKTVSLSLWALSCHRLPEAVLGPRCDHIVSALQRCLDGTGRSGNTVLDGLKAVSHTIEQYPAAFLDLLFPLLPFVMANLRCESPELRFHASMAVGKFANALVNQTELSLSRWQTLSAHITSSLELCCNESQVAYGGTSFSHIVQAVFSAESYAHPRDAPSWILAILASWIVLCGPTLYAEPTILRFILQTLAISLTHRRSVVRALHPHVWRCFVWTFSQMLLSSENVDPTLISSAFYVIRQEVSGGIGVALASAILSDQVSATQPEEHGVRISQALSVIKAMVRAECKHTRREGFVLLQALTHGAQTGHQIPLNMYRMPASALLNGVIMGADWDRLPSIIHSVPQVPVSVHRLQEAEIGRHYKSLLAIWKYFAIKVDMEELNSDLFDVWFSILHRLDFESHVTMATEVLGYTAAIIIEFLPSVAMGDSQSGWASWDVCDQIYRLTFIHQLWSAMQKAFIAFSLAEAAALILTSVLKHAFHVLDHSVGTLWSSLCANLMTTVSQTFLRKIEDLTESQLVIHDQRELWGVVATSLSSFEPGLDWKGIARFLAIPICAWVLSEPELQAWEALLRNAITLSSDPAMVAGHLVEQYFQGTDVETWESIVALLKSLLTCTHERGNFPADRLLSLVNVCLTLSYSRTCRSPDTLTHSLELLNVIRHVIASNHDKVMRVLHALRGSLCLWIEDHAEVMSDDEFNSVAVSLYCEALEALGDLPLSMQSLQDTETFIASAFCRIPTPAIAPFAFEKFWRATYHGRSKFCDVLPPKIKSCLTCFVAAYGGDLADGLLLATDSQSQSISDPSRAHFYKSHEPRVSAEFDEDGSSSTSADAALRPEEFDMDVAPDSSQQAHTNQDTDFPIPFADDNAMQPTVLRLLREYSSRTDITSPVESEVEQWTGVPQMLSSPLSPPGGVTTSSDSPELIHAFTSRILSRKRKLADTDDAPRKRSRTSRDILRSLRKLESEPATRDITPVDVPRTSSMPPRKRMVFDGVHVPTFRELSRWKTVQRAEGDKNALSHASTSQIPLSSSTQRRSRSRTPSSDEDYLNWENYHVDATSSEASVDRSLGVACASSSGPSRSSSPHSTSGHSPDAEPDIGSYRCLGPSFPRAMSQNENSPPRTRPSLRRSKTTSARLDALQDVYSSMANGASQIPMSELLQATRLVHQIGAVLTEQMGKKMGE